MSSVFGLNDSPQTPMTLPFRLPKCTFILVKSRVFCSAFTTSTALRILKS